MIIVFMGGPGSGKSTHINKLLKSKILKNYEVVFKPEDKFFLLDIYKKLFGANTTSQFVESKKHGVGKNFKMNFLRHLIAIFYPLAILAEYTLDYIHYEILSKNKILLKERYIYDYVVTLNCNLDINLKAINQIFLAFPKPFINVFLDVDARTSRNRNTKKKAEGWENKDKLFHQKVVKVYRKIAKHKKATKFNATRKVNNTHNQIVALVENKLILKKARTITLSGMDGSGKSSLAKALEGFAKSLGINVKVIHFYHDNMLFKLFKKTGIIKPQIVNENYFSQSRKHSTKTSDEGRPFIWACAHFLDSLVQYLASRAMYPKSLLIYDRFLFDYFVSFENLKVPGRRVFNLITPHPENRYLLETSYQKAHRRKPENNLQFFKFAASEYKKVAKEHNLKSIESGNKSIEQIKTEIIKNLQ